MADAQTIAVETGGRGRLADLIVLVAMTAFSMALAVGFHHQLGLPMWLSGGVAASIFAGCLALHVLLVRSIRLERLEAEVERLRRHTQRPPSAERSTQAATSQPDATEPRARAANDLPSGETASAPAASPSGSAEAATSAADVQIDPVAVASSPAPDAPAAQRDAVVEHEAAAGNPRPADFEMIQGLVKKLALEVAANERKASEGGAAPAPSPAPPAAAIDVSVEALNAAAGSMHRADRSAPAVPAAPPGDTGFAYRPGEAGHYLPAAQAMMVPGANAAAIAPTETAVPPRPELMALAAALQGQRIDVMLEPILGLREQHASHYEVSLRFRDERGEALDVLEQPAGLAGSGLLPLIDIARLSRTAEVARRLKSRGADGSVFSDLAAESLVDDDFLNRVAAAYRAEAQFASGLVMAFTQAEARAFTPAQWETLLHMRDLGFRFSLKDITDLDMDFEALAKAGFLFAKLDAEVFLVGLPMDGGNLPSRDICRHLADAGLTLIVGHIEQEQQLVRVLGFGALLGQGSLFGEPRPMRAELFQRPDTAAA